MTNRQFTFAKMKWTKAYQGPFTESEAERLVQDLRKKPVMDGVRKRKRKGGKEWDVYILI